MTWSRTLEFEVPFTDQLVTISLDHRIKNLGVSLVLGVMLVFVLLFGYWLRSPFAISTQWSHSVDRGLEPVDLTSDRVGR